MSDNIDERIVRMEFDNKQFNDGVKETQKNLKSLNESLKFEDSSKSFDNITRAANNVDLSNITKNVGLLQKSFTALGEFSQGIIANIANDVYAKSKQLINNLSFAQVNAGYSKYESNLKSVQTIMAATGKDIEEVQQYMKKLNWYTDETSYSLNDMTANISRFTSAGIDLHEATDAMIGIANAAGLAGADVTSATHAMQGFAKAMGTGYMSTINWNWIETAHMDTMKVKEEFIKAGVELGNLVKGVNEAGEAVYYTTEKTAKAGEEITAQTFRNTLAESKWLNKEVMTYALNNFSKYSNMVYDYWKKNGGTTSDAIDAINKEIKEKTAAGIEDVSDLVNAKLAFESAQVARTFGDAISAVKDAVSTNWMNLFEEIFGNYKESVDMWTAMANDLWEVFVPPIQAITDRFDAWHHMTDAMKSDLGKLYGGGPIGSYEDFQAAIINLFDALAAIADKVHDAFAKVLPPVTVIASKVRKFYLWTDKIKKKVTPVEEAVTKAANTVTDAIDNTAEGVEKVTDTVKTLQDVANDVIRGDWQKAPTRFKALEEAGYSWQAVQNKVNETLGCSKRYEYETDKVDAATGRLIASQTEQTATLQEAVDKTVESIETNEKHYTVLDNITTILKAFGNAIGLVKDVGKAVIDNIVKPAIKFIGIIAKGLLGLTAQFAEIISNAITWLRTSGKIQNGIKSFVNFFKEKFGPAIDQIEEFFNGLSDRTNNSVITFFDNLGDSIRNLTDAIGQSAAFQKFTGILGKIWNGITGFAGGVWSKITGTIQTLGGEFAQIKASDFDWVWNVLGTGLGVLALGIEKLYSVLNSFWTWFKGTDIVGYYQKKLKKMTEWTGINLKNPFTKEEKRINGIKTTFLEKVFGFTDDQILLVRNANGLFNKQGNGIIQEFFKQVSKTDWGVAASNTVKDAGTNLKAFFTSITGIDTNNLGSVTDNLKGFFGTIIEPLTNILPGFVNVVSTAWNSFKGFITDKDKIKAFVEDLVNIIPQFMIAYGIMKGMGGLGKMGTSIANFFEVISKGMEGITKAIRFSMVSSSLLKIAAAIAILAASLIALTKVNQDDLRQATISLSILVGTVAALMLVMGIVSEMITTDQKSIVRAIYISGSVALLAAAIYVMGQAVAKAAELSWGEFGKGLLRCAIMLGVLLLVFYGLTEIQNITKRVGNWRILLVNIIGLYVISLSIEKLVNALVTISKMPLHELRKSIKVLIPIFIGLAALMGFASKIGWGAGFTMIAGVMTLWLFLEVLKKFQTLDLDTGTILKVILSVIAIIGVMLALQKVLGGMGKVSPAIGINVLGFCLGIYVLALAVERLGKMDITALAKGGITVAILTLVLGKAMEMVLRNVWGTGIKEAMASITLMTVLIGGIVVLCAAVVILGSQDSTVIGQGLAVVSALMVLFALVIAATNLARGVKTGPMIALVVGIGILCAAVYFIAKDIPLATLDGVVKDIYKILGAIAIAIIEAAVVAGLVNKFSGELFSAITTISMLIAEFAIIAGGGIGLGAAIAGWGLGSLGKSLKTIGDAITSISNGFKSIKGLDLDKIWGNQDHGLHHVLKEMNEIANNSGKNSGVGIKNLCDGVFMLSNALPRLSKIDTATIRKTMESLGTGFKSFALALADDNVHTFYFAEEKGQGIAALAESSGTLADAVAKLVPLKDAPLADILEAFGTAFKDFADALKEAPVWSEGKGQGIAAVAESCKTLADGVSELAGLSGPEFARVVNPNTGILVKLGQAMKDFGTAVSETSILNDADQIVQLIDALGTAASEDIAGTGLIGAVEEFMKINIDGTAGAAITEIGTGLQSFATAVQGTSWFDNAGGIVNLINNLGENGLAGGLKALLEVVPIYQGEMLWKYLSGIGLGFQSFANALTNDGPGGTFADIFSSFFGVWESKANAISTAISSMQMMSTVVRSFKGLGDEDISSSIEKMKTTLTDMQGIITGFTDTIGGKTGVDRVTQFTNAMQNLYQTLYNWSTNMGDDNSFIKFGQSLAVSIKTGFDSGVDGNLDLSEWITHRIENILNSVMLHDWTAVYNSAELIGQTCMTRIIDGVNGEWGTLETTMTTMLDNASTKITDRKGEFSTNGAALIKALASGFSGSASGNSSDISTTNTFLQKIRVLMATGKTTIDGFRGSKDNPIGFYAAGANLVAGLIEGVQSKTVDYVNAMIALAQAGNDAFTSHKGTDQASPSKLYHKYGMYIDEGLSNGIRDGAALPVASVLNMADSINNGMSTAILSIGSVLGSDFANSDPVIRPVLDLSNVESGVKDMDSMFGPRTLAAGINSSMARRSAQIQNGSNKTITIAPQITINGDYTSEQGAAIARDIDRQLGALL